MKSHMVLTGYYHKSATAFPQRKKARPLGLSRKISGLCLKRTGAHSTRNTSQKEDFFPDLLNKIRKKVLAKGVKKVYRAKNQEEARRPYRSCRNGGVGSISKSWSSGKLKLIFLLVFLRDPGPTFYSP